MLVGITDVQQPRYMASDVQHYTDGPAFATVYNVSTPFDTPVVGTAPRDEADVQALPAAVRLKGSSCWKPRKRCAIAVRCLDRVLCVCDLDCCGQSFLS